MDAKKQSVYDTYLQHLAIKGLVKTTTDLYAKEAKAFIEFVDDLETINASIVFEYLKRYTGLSGSSKNSHYSSLRTFLKHLKKNVYLNMRTIKIPYFKSNCKLPEILSQDELMKRLNIVKKKAEESDQWMDKRDYALVMLLYATGMRVSEALSFDRSDINEDNWVRIDSGKGLKDRFVPIAKSAINALDAYVKACPLSLNKGFFVSYNGSSITRVTVYKILKSCMGMNPHSMRHHFATHMIINGADVSIVSELLGHSSLITTQIYTHIQKPQLIKTVNNCHPMAEGKVMNYE